MLLRHRLHQLRMERDQRLHQVAQGTGLSVPYLSDLERGRCTPTLDTLTKIADHHGLSLKAVLAPVTGFGSDLADGLSMDALPLALRTYLERPTIPASPDMVRLLASIEHRGHRPREVRDYAALHLVLDRAQRTWL